MEVSFVSHTRIHPLTQNRMPAEVFPAYVCQTSREGVSLAVCRDGAVLAAAVDGSRFGLFEAVGPWLFGTDLEAQDRLLDELAQTGIPHGLEFPLSLESRVRRRFPAATLSQDLLLSLQPPQFQPASAPGRLVWLSAGDARWTNLSDMLRRQVASLEGFSPESPLWCWEVEGRVVAMADTLVRAGGFACFGQVVTDPRERRKGYARALVSAVCSALLAQKLVPLWFASVAHESSLKFAQELGFREAARFGCVEFGDVQEGMADIE